jgi:GNAT superfamily N-acetyltransferase
MEQRIAAVWVLYDPERVRIEGYYSLSAVGVEREGLPPEVTHRTAQCEVYSATLIGRLAADQDYAGQRIGERLLHDALARSVKASRQVASLAVVTDAKNRDVQLFYQHYGFMILPSTSHELRLFLPMRTAEKMFVEEGRS